MRKTIALLLLAASLPASGLAAAAPDNPLLTESTLPLHYPQFDLIKEEHYLPALLQGMAEEQKEAGAIATNPAKPTFDNTIVALERSGSLLSRVNKIFSNVVQMNTTPALDTVNDEIAPKLAAHRDTIHMNAALFARVQAVYDARASLGLDAESVRLIERYYLDFVRAGAKLSEADKAKLKTLHGEIAALETTFVQNTLKDANASAITVDDRAQLAGLSDDQIAATVAAAKTAGKEGKFVLSIKNTSGQPLLASLQNRALRAQLMAASLARGSHGGPFDNREIVARLVKKRAEAAALLGYPSYAAYALADQTAGTVANVNNLLPQLSQPAVSNARREAADLQALVDAEKGGFQIAAHDWTFYSEKVRAARYAFDESQLKPYFELNHVLIDGVFFAAGKLYGLTFKERHDLPVYEPSVRVFDVFDTDGKQLAILLIDYYARASKQGGAWMNEYVTQSALTGDLPVVGNHLNIPQPPAGQPTLLTFDEVKTAFHEFGHALHGMFSHVKYPYFGGTSVPNDFGEYPSQVNEMWQTWPEVLKNYAKHYQTGAPIPPALLDKVLNAKKFNQGYETTEKLAAMLLDQAWHQLGAAEVPAADGVLAFEAAALKKYGVEYAPVPPRYRTTYFSHIFSNQYPASYYAYIWSEVLDADTVDWIKTHGGLTRANGDRFRATLLSRGGSVDAMQLFRDMTGGEPDIKPLVVRHGLDAPAK